MKRKILIGITLVIVILTGIIVYFLYNNTALLNTNIDETDITANNSNLTIPTATPNNEVTQAEIDAARLLVTRKVAVPERFQEGIFTQDRELNLPQGFTIGVFAAGLEQPRFMDVMPDGTLLAADKGTGEILVLADQNKDNAADGVTRVLSDLNHFHDLKYYEGDLYLAEEHQISVLRDFEADGSYSEREVIVSELPNGRALSTKAGHVTRTIEIGPDEKLYVSVGSSCNICEEEDPRRAAIVRYDLNGDNEEIFATGLRNTVGFVFHQEELWGVDMGRDRIGDDIPPEEVNIVEFGKDYGWPFCYGSGVFNPEYPDRDNYCQSETGFSVFEMQAHSAPLGINFIPEEFVVDYGRDFADNFVVAFHGSWNRTTPTGYKVVRINANNPNKSDAVINFVTGWLETDGNYWGRPAGVEFGLDGELYISDDYSGVIYVVRKV